MNVLMTVLLAAAGTLIICAIVASLLSFSTRRAQQLRYHENAIVTAEYVPHTDTQPERIIVYERIDRHIYYIGIMTALWFAGVGVMLVPIGTGALALLDQSTQKLVAFAMMLGSSLSLLGSSLGPPKHHRWWNPMRWWFPHFNEGQAYGIGAGGQIAIGVACAAFGWAVIINGTVIGTVTGLMTPILSWCAFRFAHCLWAEHKRLNTQWWALKRAATGEDD